MFLIENPKIAAEIHQKILENGAQLAAALAVEPEADDSKEDS